MANPYVPKMDVAGYLFKQYFLNRTDFIPVLFNDQIFPVIYSEDVLISHLTGHKVLVFRKLLHENKFVPLFGSFKCGAYLPDKNNKSKYVCIDFDGKGHASPLKDSKEAVIKSYLIFKEQGISCNIECSSGGTGYHLWIFFDFPIEAKLIRALCFALVPKDILLESNITADVWNGKGIEVYPKTNALRKDGLGNQIWLPFHNNPKPGGSCFYKYTEDSLEPYIPGEFAVNNINIINQVINKFGGADKIFSSISSSFKVYDKTENNQNPEWREWRQRALKILDLKAIYGDLLIEERNNNWIKCRDPWSESGDKSPSAGVSLGLEGQPERGTFHSFISGENLSVFDFIRRRGLVEDTHLAACRYIAELSGFPLPTSPSSNTNNINNENSEVIETNPVEELPIINITNRQFRDILNDSWSAVINSNLKSPYLFTKSSLLVRLNLKEEIPTISILNEAEVYGILARTANWVRTNNQGFMHVAPVEKIARDMLNCDYELKDELPEINFITTVPMFSCDRKLVSSEGYDRSDKLWFKKVKDLENMEEIPLIPTRQQLNKAVDLLLNDLFCDFPLVCTADTCHLFGALFLPFIRQLIDGPTPLHIVEAPIAGTGKGKLCNIISILSTGGICEARTVPNNDDDIRKMLTAELIKSRPIILLDNASERKKLDSPSLASMLTSTWWTDRILGETRMVRLSNNALWLLTANNPQLSMEIARRCIRIRLDAHIDQPWRRKDFKHKYIEEWAKENRARLIHAILTCIQYWISNSCPISDKRLGSFEKWSSVIGGILNCIGLEGFLGNLEELYEMSDVEGNSWRVFILKWFSTFGLHPIKTADLLKFCEEWGFLDSIIGEGTQKIKLNRLVNGLRSVRDRVINNYKIDEIKDINTVGGTFKLTEVNENKENKIEKIQILDKKQEDNNLEMVNLGPKHIDEIIED